MDREGSCRLSRRSVTCGHAHVPLNCMTSPFAPEHWDTLWRSLGATRIDDGLQGTLLAHYDQPHRHYHARAHLAACLRHLGDLRGFADHPGAIELALWFHDAIYEIGATDNEVRSADWARDALRAAGAPEAIARKVHALVMVTRHDVAPSDADEQVLLDADLAILGASAEAFDRYEGQIRAEFAQVPPDAFRARRKRVLQGFLDRPAIYHTPPFRAAREARARDNLSRSIRQLGG